MKYLLAFLVSLIPAAALAQEDMTLTSEVLVERVRTDAQGKEERVLEEPKAVVPGDTIVIEISYRNAGSEAATDFVVTNPLPAAVAFAGGETPGAVVSVDGGQNWGDLASLTVAQPDGTTRAAQATDVTHIRWAFGQPVPAGQEGKLSFRGTVK